MNFPRNRDVVSVVCQGECNANGACRCFTLEDAIVDDEVSKRAASPIMRYFYFGHLPEELQAVSRPIAELAQEMDKLPDSAEKSAGLRKLLEAKDCFVRAALS